MKRPDWLSRRIATQKALRELPKCDWAFDCEGKAMGVLARPLGNGDVEWVLACVKCAADAQRAQREKRT